MRRKLFAALGLLTLISVLSGAVILKNLSVITGQQKLEKTHEDVLSRYRTMLYLMRSAQSELYRHEAGYSRNIDVLVEHMLHFEELLGLMAEDHENSRALGDCRYCHSGGEKGDLIGPMLVSLSDKLRSYEEKISFIVTSGDDKFTAPIETNATGEGEEIVDIIEGMRGQTAEMTDRIEERQNKMVDRSRYAIFVAIFLGTGLALASGVLLIRAITRPVDMLVAGIEKVSSGDYASRVDVSSDDEIGFLAQTFNAMTENLGKMTIQKEELLSELHGVNEDLEHRVRAATEELKLTHEKLLRNETLSVVGTFAAGVAHELATPISSVMSYLQMVKKRVPENEALSEDICIMESELRRCTRILRGMLDFAKAPEQEKLPTDVNAIIRDLLMLIRYQKEYRNILIKEDLDAAVPTVMAVPGQLKQVFMNIILNGLQAMAGAGELLIATTAQDDGDSVVVSVSDTGPGLLDSELGKIFQPFYTSKNSGTGLGLSISHGIVKGHGGEIRVRSDYGKGTTFSVSLPVRLVSNKAGNE